MCPPSKPSPLLQSSFGGIICIFTQRSAAVVIKGIQLPKSLAATCYLHRGLTLEESHGRAYRQILVDRCLFAY